MEILRVTGLPPSSLMQPARGLPGGITKLTLFNADRLELHRRIEQRFRRMLERGLEAEVARIADSVSAPDASPALRSVGYRQVLQMLRGDLERPEMVDRAVAATRQLAKRQLTWLRQQAGLVWIPADAGGARDSVTRYLQSHPAYVTYSRSF
jgi:tRNA dimethylallyltransferase